MKDAWFISLLSLAIILVLVITFMTGWETGRNSVTCNVELSCSCESVSCPSPVEQTGDACVRQLRAGRAFENVIRRTLE